MVFQAFHLIPGLTIEENVALPLRLRGESSTSVRTQATEMLGQSGNESSAWGIAPMSCQAVSSSGWRLPGHLYIDRN